MNKIDFNRMNDLFNLPKMKNEIWQNEFMCIPILHFGLDMRIIIPSETHFSRKDDFYGNLFLQKQRGASHGIQADDRPL